MAKVWGLIATGSLLLMGCGDDDSSSEGEADSVEAAETAPEDTEDVGDVVDDLDFGDGTARVSVGDVDYEFSLGGSEEADGTTYIGTCQELFDVIAGNGFVAGDPSTTIEFEIPPPDWETYDDGRFDGSTPRIEIELGDEGGWAADLSEGESNPELAGQSQLDEWTLEGGVAVGSATFIEMESFSAPVEGAAPVEGSFEIGCGES